MNSTSKNQDEMKILKSIVLIAKNLEFKTLFVKIVVYFSVPIGVPGGKSGCMFTPVNVEITCYEPEIVGGMLIRVFVV
jgi:hypothetical protein